MQTCFPPLRFRRTTVVLDFRKVLVPVRVGVDCRWGDVDLRSGQLTFEFLVQL